MAKLKERWHARKDALIKSIESGERPDLVKQLMAAEHKKKYDEEHRRSIKKDAVEPKEKEKTIPTEMVGDVQLADVVREIMNNPKFKDQLMKSPGLMQMAMNKVLGASGEQTIIVEPTVFRIVQVGDTIKELDPRPLGLEPSVPVSARVKTFKKTQELENDDPPTPLNRGEIEQRYISSSNDDVKLGTTDPQPPDITGEG